MFFDGTLSSIKVYLNLVGFSKFKHPCVGKKSANLLTCILFTALTNDLTFILWFTLFQELVSSTEKCNLFFQIKTGGISLHIHCMYVPVSNAARKQPRMTQSYCQYTETPCKSTMIILNLPKTLKCILHPQQGARYPNTLSIHSTYIYYLSFGIFNALLCACIVRVLFYGGKMANFPLRYYLNIMTHLFNTILYINITYI